MTRTLYMNVKGFPRHLETFGGQDCVNIKKITGTPRSRHSSIAGALVFPARL